MARIRVFTVGTLFLGAFVVACVSSPSDDTLVVPGAIPFGCDEQARYVLEKIDGTPVAIGMLETRCDGGKWLLTQSYVPPGTAASDKIDVAQVVAHVETLAPELSSRKTTLAGAIERWDAEYSADGSSVKFSHIEPDGGVDEQGLRLNENAYENESALWLWRALTLDEGYDGRYVSVSAVRRNQVTVRLGVVQQEWVEVPAGRFATWRLQVRSGRATRVAWIGIEPPYPLVRWDNGEQIFRLLSLNEGRGSP